MSEKVKSNTYEIAKPEHLCFYTKRTDLVDVVTKIWENRFSAANLENGRQCFSGWNLRWPYIHIFCIYVFYVCAKFHPFIITRTIHSRSGFTTRDFPKPSNSVDADSTLSTDTRLIRPIVLHARLASNDLFWLPRTYRLYVRLHHGVSCHKNCLRFSKLSGLCPTMFFLIPKALVFLHCCFL